MKQPLILNNFGSADCQGRDAKRNLGPGHYIREFVIFSISYHKTKLGVHCLVAKQRSIHDVCTQVPGTGFCQSRFLTQPGVLGFFLRWFIN